MPRWRVVITVGGQRRMVTVRDTRSTSIYLSLKTERQTTVNFT